MCHHHQLSFSCLDRTFWGWTLGDGYPACFPQHFYCGKIHRKSARHAAELCVEHACQSFVIAVTKQKRMPTSRKGLCWAAALGFGPRLGMQQGKALWWEGWQRKAVPMMAATKEWGREDWGLAGHIPITHVLQLCPPPAFYHIPAIRLQIYWEGQVLRIQSLPQSPPLTVAVGMTFNTSVLGNILYANHGRIEW